jgi:hypothetical protein
MKQIAILMAAIMFPLATFAQNDNTAANDTINNGLDPEVYQNLQEVVIEAPKVVHKSDMDVFYPSSSAVEHSKNGVQLVRNLMIPTLSVNDVMGSITTSGESVQVRINGREATIDQVKNLLPESVKRVEWLDNPGLRYKGAVAVLNFIVVNPMVGGSLMVDGLQALNCSWGRDNLSLKLNNGHSQFGVTAQYKLTNRLSTYRDYNETFTFADGSSLTRTETPQDGFSSDNHSSFQVDYSYTKPDTTTFWVAFHGYKQLDNKKLFDGIMDQSNGDNDIHLRDYTSRNGFTPSLQAYLEQHFAHKQTIAVDFNASFYNGRSSRTYTEHDNISSALLNDVFTSIKDHNRAYGVEADYIKKWSNARLTVGASYNANRNRSRYDNLGGAVYHQRQDQTYFFGEYFQRIQKVTFTAGIGAQYTDFKFRETKQGNNSWDLRPQFSATYKPNSASMFSLNLSSWQTAPSLEQTNIAPSQTDGIQWRIGNPDLQTSSSYMLTMRYKYTSKRLTGTFSIRAYESPDYIAPYLYWQDDKLFTSYENSKGLKWVAFTIAPQIDVIPKWVSLSGALQYRVDQSKGNGYKHTNRNLNGNVALTAYHWGFSLVVQYEKAPKRLYGEKFIWGETMSLAMLNYDWKKWEFGVGLLCPFNKYDTGNQSLNRYNRNTTHLRLDMSSMPIVSISYNLQWGHQKRGVSKMVDADAHVETSSAGGR